MQLGPAAKAVVGGVEGIGRTSEAGRNETAAPDGADRDHRGGYSGWVTHLFTIAQSVLVLIHIRCLSGLFSGPDFGSSGQDEP